LERLWGAFPFWSGFDFLSAATAALRCSAYFTALQFTELWCERKLHETKFGDARPLHVPSPECAGSERLVRICRDNLFDIFRNTGEPDSLCGLGAEHRRDTHEEIVTSEHNGQWQTALSLRAAELLPEAIASSDGSRAAVDHQRGLLVALRNLGHLHVVDRYLRGLG
jgi:hypothetical protein